MRAIYDLHGWLVSRWLRAGFSRWWPGRLPLLAVRLLIDWHQGWMQREVARRAKHRAERFAARTKDWQRQPPDDT